MTIVADTMQDESNFVEVSRAVIEDGGDVYDGTTVILQDVLNL